MAAPGEAALVQYVVLRGDLRRAPLSWPLGALVAQGCHAALAAAHAHRDHPDTRAYLAEGGAMRIVVLEAADEAVLRALAERLRRLGLDHALWTEQPEAAATCLALRPYPRREVRPHLRALPLLR
ncbi:putative peptidyl-tRNA hydrolase PTRHD1 [Rhea pennata]|uniref:putative peptidyl-tRNA hydrolase PTRHD1 n=1 Tax=Rhea pennata TaxID=8795 RepID=UPI002E2523EB